MIREYYTKLRNIWKLELASYNKAISYNAFVVPVSIPTFEILDWLVEEIHSLDSKTLKILTIIGNFHRNNDFDRLYLKRNVDGRDLRSVHSNVV